MKKKPMVLPPERMVIAGVETSVDGRLERVLTNAFAKGYTLVCPPVYAGTTGISPVDSMLGERPHPQFLVILQKLPSTPSP